MCSVLSLAVGEFCIIPLGLSGLRSNRIEVVVLTEAKALPKVSPVCDGPDTFPWLPETEFKKSNIYYTR